MPIYNTRELGDPMVRQSILWSISHSQSTLLNCWPNNRYIIARFLFCFSVSFMRQILPGSVVGQIWCMLNLPLSLSMLGEMVQAWGQLCFVAINFVCNSRDKLTRTICQWSPHEQRGKILLARVFSRKRAPLSHSICRFRWKHSAGVNTHPMPLFIQTPSANNTTPNPPRKE
jgi:hypothetical protein